MHEFVDRHYVVHCAPVDDEALTDWAISHELISERKHITNVKMLLDANEGKKHLNYFVPLRKLQWLRKVDQKAGEPVAGRLPEAVVGNAKFFVENIVPRKRDMGQIKSHTTLGSYLKGGYRPNGKDGPPAWHYGGWQHFHPTRDEALQWLTILHQGLVPAHSQQPAQERQPQPDYSVCQEAVPISCGREVPSLWAATQTKSNVGLCGKRMQVREWMQVCRETDLSREGVDPQAELLEFYALVAAALARGVQVVAHNASFDMARLNHTCVRHHVSPFPLRSAHILCTMHNATKHCGLRKRGGKSLKPPKNEELFRHLFKRSPSGRLHRALPDCRVTLACFVKGRQLHWW